MKKMDLLYSTESPCLQVSSIAAKTELNIRELSQEEIPQFGPDKEDEVDEQSAQNLQQNLLQPKSQQSQATIMAEPKQDIKVLYQSSDQLISEREQECKNSDYSDILVKKNQVKTYDIEVASNPFVALKTHTSIFEQNSVLKKRPKKAFQLPNKLKNQLKSHQASPKR